MDVLPAYKSILHVCYVHRGQGGIRPLETGVTDGCVPPHECWKLNPGSLEEQPMLLTTQLSFQPLCTTSKGYFSMYCLKFLFKATLCKCSPCMIQFIHFKRTSKEFSIELCTHQPQSILEHLPHHTKNLRFVSN